MSEPNANRSIILGVGEISLSGEGSESNRFSINGEIDFTNVSSLERIFDEKSIRVLTFAEEYAKAHVEAKVEPIHLFISILRIDSRVIVFFIGVWNFRWTEECDEIFAQIESLRRQPTPEERQLIHDQYFDIYFRSMEYSESSKQILLEAFDEVSRQSERRLVKYTDILYVMFHPKSRQIDRDIEHVLNQMNANISQLQAFVRHLWRDSNAPIRLVSVGSNDSLYQPENPSDVPALQDQNAEAENPIETSEIPQENSQENSHENSQEKSEELLDSVVEVTYGVEENLQTFAQLLKRIHDQRARSLVQSSDAHSEVLTDYYNYYGLIYNRNTLSYLPFPYYPTSLYYNRSYLNHHIAPFQRQSMRAYYGMFDRNIYENWGFFINSYIIDLTEQEKCVPEFFYGRSAEVEKILNLFQNRLMSNAMLIGNPGVGKTAVGFHFIHLILRGKVPVSLKNCKVCSVDFEKIVRDAHSKHDFERRVKLVLDRLRRQDKYILFIDDIHSVLNIGEIRWELSVGSILVHYLTSRRICCFSTCSTHGYMRYIRGVHSLKKNFYLIHLQTTSYEETLELMHRYQCVYLQKHHIFITSSAISEAIRLSNLYDTLRIEPGNVLELLDSARKIEEEHSICQRFYTADTSSEHPSSPSRTNHILDKMINSKMQGMVIRFVTSHVINYVAEKHYNSNTMELPQFPIELLEKEVMEELKNTITGGLICQTVGIESLCKYFIKCIHMPTKTLLPLGSVLLCGAKGEAKTLTIDLWSKYFFHNSRIISINLKKHGNADAVSKLFGSRFTDSQSDESGTLIKQVETYNFYVLVFDLIEKAHRSVLDYLLQILQRGYIMDANKRVVFFKNTFIFITTNIGNEMVQAYFKEDITYKLKGKLYDALYQQRSTSSTVTHEENTESVALEESQRRLENWYADLLPTVKTELNRRLKRLEMNVGSTILYRNILQRDIKRILSNCAKEFKKQIWNRKKLYLNISNKILSFLADPTNVKYNLKKGSRSIEAAFNKLIKIRLANFLADRSYGNYKELTLTLNEYNVIQMILQY